MNAAAPPTALVVDPDVSHRAGTVTTLTSAGFRVSATDGFEAARRRLVDQPPAVLVTALKLGEYNGFHLVLRARTATPRTAAIVTSDDGGTVFRKEAAQTGATFVVDPVTSQDLLAAVLRTLFRHDPTVPIEPPFERRMGERRTTRAEHHPDRRARNERRRDMGTLLQVAGLG